MVEARTGFEPAIRVLQTRALPLGYLAPPSAPPSREPPAVGVLERKTGFEPATFSLARRRATTAPLPLAKPEAGAEEETRTPTLAMSTAPSTLRVYQFHHLGTHSFARFPLAGVEGLEPPTYGFGDRCSAKLSYTPSARTS